MSQPFIGEVRMFGGSFAPAGWAFCDGALLAISEYDTLYTLIGTTYGGDGQSTFALPDLRGRIPVHAGQAGGLQNYTLGEKAGAETVTLGTSQVPIHTHAFLASTAVANSNTPANQIPAQSTQRAIYYEDVPQVPLAASVLQPAGGSQPHENMMPYLGVSFIISLFGIYPPA
jgi:microcystin-dependent protein